MYFCQFLLKYNLFFETKDRFLMNKFGFREYYLFMCDFKLPRAALAEKIVCNPCELYGGS